MSGRHQARRRHQYAGRHRATVRHTGAISLAALAIVGVTGGLSASYALSHGSEGQHGHVAAAASLPADRALSLPTVSPSTSPSASPAVQRAKSHHRAVRHAGLPLLILRTTNGPSWIAVSRAGHQLIGRTVAAHHRLVFRGRHLHVTVGNAGAVAVRIGNGHPNRAGRPGQVRSFTA